MPPVLNPRGGDRLRDGGRLVGRDDGGRVGLVVGYQGQVVVLVVVVVGLVTRPATPLPGLVTTAKLALTN